MRSLLTAIRCGGTGDITIRGDGAGVRPGITTAGMLRVIGMRVIGVILIGIITITIRTLHGVV